VGTRDAWIDSPADGATFNRVPPAPYALIDFKASGVYVGFTGAAANQLILVNWEMSFLVGSQNPPTTILARDVSDGNVLIQADALGAWTRYAQQSTPDEGELEKDRYGVGPGNWIAMVKCILVAGGDTVVNWSHDHEFTVN